MSASLLAELARRTPPTESVRAKQEEAIAVAEKLRARYHAKQRAFYRSAHKRKATKKTRRAGATDGGVRELIARSLLEAGHRATVVHTTRIEAKSRAWENDTKSGFIDLLNQTARVVDRPGVLTYDIGGMLVEVREQELALFFENGSHIELFGADEERALRKKRGHAKHVFWVDECQDFRFLEKFYKAIVVGSLTDYDGEAWLTGTPGQDCAGMFYNITADEDERLPGWEVHEIAVTDNPFFGHAKLIEGQWFVVDNRHAKHGPYADEAAAEAAAVDIRWENTAGQAIRENNWQPDDPDLLREWYAKWVKGDARYVYPVHSIPKHKLTFAPMRTVENPLHVDHPAWYDHERAVLDLPRAPNGRAYEWLYAIGADFGYFPDPFALVVWAFTFERPDIYEMLSWKQTKVLPSDQRSYIELLWKVINNIVVFVGDGAGKTGDFKEWEQRFQLPMEPSDKSGRNAQEEMFAGDIRGGLVHYREDSPLLHEHKHLVYLPLKTGKTREVHATRKISNGTIPGDHCSDAGRYAHKHLRHFTFREPPKDDRTALAKQEDRYIEQIEQIDRIRDMLEAEESYGWNDGYE